VHSLNGRPELNETYGCIVRERHAATGRYGILVDGFSFSPDMPLKKSIALKASNMDVMTEELDPYLENEASIERMYQTSTLDDVVDVLTATHKVSFLAESAVRALLFWTAKFVQVPGTKMSGAKRAIRALLRCMVVQASEGSLQTLACLVLVNLATDVEMIEIAALEGVMGVLLHAFSHPQAQPSACKLLRNLCTQPHARILVDTRIVSAVVTSIAMNATGLVCDNDESSRAADGCLALCNMLQVDWRLETRDEVQRRQALAVAANAADVIATVMIWWPDKSRVLFAAIAALEALCSGDKVHNERAAEQLTQRACLPIIVAAVGMGVEPGLDSVELGIQRPDELSERACSLIAKLSRAPPLISPACWTPPTSQSNLDEQHPRIKALINAGAIEAIVRSIVGRVGLGLGDCNGCFALEMLGCFDHPSDGGVEENHQRALAAGAHPEWLTC